MSGQGARTTRTVAKVFIKGRVEDVWREITKTPEPQACFFNAIMDVPALRPGAPLRMRSKDRKYTFVVGEILEFDPPRRFSHTFRLTNRDDPECRVTYVLEPVEGGVEFTLISDGVPVGTPTEKDMAGGNRAILRTLKQVVENGRPSLGTRILYAVLPAMSFLLPKQMRSENWR